MTNEPSTSSFSKESIFSKITTEFKKDTIKEVLKLQYNDGKSKITEDACELVKEVLKVIVVESAIRTAKQATMENNSAVNIQHVESVLIQMMLDFP